MPFIIFVREASMISLATQQKRKDLLTFIEAALKADPAVQGVAGIGSIATGLSPYKTKFEKIG
jgi:hypothetical protein